MIILSKDDLKRKVLHYKYDEYMGEERLVGYYPIWGDWPLIPYGVHWDEEEVKCPRCDFPLTATGYIVDNSEYWICRYCETQVRGPIEEVPEEGHVDAQDEPLPEEAVRLQGVHALERKYAYLIG